MTRPEYRLIVAGGRKFTDEKLLAASIFALAHGPLCGRTLSIISGMAKGADALGFDFAGKQGLAVYGFTPSWDTHGRSAGFKRNEEMADLAHGLLAFWDGQSKGTGHMIKIATARGLDVTVVRYSAHACHYPGCNVTVPPRQWGCMRHWRALPQRLRSAIWAAYRPGQEITKDPSPEYLAAADAVGKWCRSHPAG